jgi:hypothetical protein
MIPAPSSLIRVQLLLATFRGATATSAMHFSTTSTQVILAKTAFLRIRSASDHTRDAAGHISAACDGVSHRFGLSLSGGIAWPSSCRALSQA